MQELHRKASCVSCGFLLHPFVSLQWELLLFSLGPVILWWLCFTPDQPRKGPLTDFFGLIELILFIELNTLFKLVCFLLWHRAKKVCVTRTHSLKACLSNLLEYLWRYKVDISLQLCFIQASLYRWLYILPFKSLWRKIYMVFSPSLGLSLLIICFCVS